MDLDILYEDLALWEQDVAFPEGPWNLGLIGNQDGGRLLAEGESIWADDDFPLKEALSDPNGPSLCLDDKSSRDDDPLANWLDERVNLSEFDELLNSPDFDTVMFSLEKSAIEILEGMDPSNDTIPHNKKISSTSSRSSDEEANSLVVSNDASEEVGPPKLDEYLPSVLNCKTVTLITIEPRDIEYSPSSQASPSDSGKLECNVEQPTNTSSPESHDNVIDEPPELVVEGPDVEILMEVPVDPKEIMNSSSSSESSNATPSCSPQNSRSSKAKPSQQKSRRKPYSRTASRHSHNWEDDSLSSSSWDEQGYAPTGPRKERKRDQNRSAASRYRLKKRAEQGALDKEEAELAATNKELSQKVDQLSSEIGYLKSLMRDMLISKGLIK